MNKPRVFRWEKSYEADDGVMRWAIRDNCSDVGQFVSTATLITLYPTYDPREDSIAKVIPELLTKHFAEKENTPAKTCGMCVRICGIRDLGEPCKNWTPKGAV